MPYDPSLGTDRDYVRFLIGDTGATPEISDEEIDAILVRFPTPQCAAVQALQSIVAKSNANGGTSGPIASKSVDGISVSYATASKGQTRGDLLAQLRKDCVRAREGGRAMFKVYRS